MFWNRRKREQGLSKSPRPHHYQLAHRVMREICQEDPLRFFGLMGSDQQKKFKEILWRITADTVGEQPADMSVDELQVVTCRIKDYPTMLITMPVPRAVVEAFFVAVVLIITAEEPPDKPVTFRYFTLELGLSENNSQRTVLCEWRDTSHLNMGDGPPADLKEFAAAVEAML